MILAINVCTCLIPLITAAVGKYSNKYKGAPIKTQNIIATVTSCIFIYSLLICAQVAANIIYNATANYYFASYIEYGMMMGLNILWAFLFCFVVFSLYPRCDKNKILYLPMIIATLLFVFTIIAYMQSAADVDTYILSHVFSIISTWIMFAVYRNKAKIACEEPLTESVSQKATSITESPDVTTSAAVASPLAHAVIDSNPQLDKIISSKEYSDRTTAPLNFHKFLWWVWLPLTILTSLVSVSNTLKLAQSAGYYNWSVGVDITYSLLCVVCSAVAIIGFFKWTKLAWYAVLTVWISQSVYAFLGIIIFLSYNLDTASMLGRFIASTVWAVCVFKYYKKRKPLFFNYSPKPVTPNCVSEASEPSISSESNPSPSTAFCKKCGADLLKCAPFCRKCGTKVEDIKDGV